jgi:hemerythrin-like metal-binding protein
MKLKWNKSYNFGITEIDDGHTQIVDKMNEISELIDAGKYDAALGKAVHMAAMEREHLIVENMLLKRYGYSDIAGHTRHHNKIHQQIIDLKEALDDGDESAAKEYFERLRENIIDDILKGDLPFKSLLQHKILGL